MAKKENMATWEELNEIELERASYLINSDELIFETLGKAIENESDRFTKPLNMSKLDDLDLVHSINFPIEFLHDQLEVPQTSTMHYKCPTCKHAIAIASADFIRGIAMTSCGDCGRNAFAIEDVFSK
jgi:DNA-directed RNA polymerase subunit RPC12/RpoP